MADAQLEFATEEEVQMCFQELASMGKSIRMMVTGRIRQGKSKLVNTLMGKKVAKEGAGPRSVTHNIESFTQDVNGVQVTVIDTPGFSDLKKSDHITVSEIEKEIGKEPIDLILFCVKMDGTLQSDDCRIMRNLTRVCGQSIWKNAVFVLTCANNVKVDQTTFAKTQGEWEEMLHEYAHGKGGVQVDIAQQIPVVVAGDEEESLPGYKSWFAPFWVRAFDRTKDSAKPAYLNSTMGLNTIVSRKESLKSSLNIIGHRQIPPSVLLDGVNQASKEINWKAPEKEAKKYTHATGATPHLPTPAPDTGVTPHLPTPAPDTGVTPHLFIPDRITWLELLEKLIKAIVRFYGPAIENQSLETC